VLTATSKQFLWDVLVAIDGLDSPPSRETDSLRIAAGACEKVALSQEARFVRSEERR
jgi:hypothetical protein